MDQEVERVRTLLFTWSENSSSKRALSSCSSCYFELQFCYTTFIIIGYLRTFAFLPARNSVFFLRFPGLPRSFFW